MMLEYSCSPYTSAVWPHRVGIYYHHSISGLISTARLRKIDEIDKWCSDTFDAMSFVSIGETWHFKNKEDAMVFLLRWS